MPLVRTGVVGAGHLGYHHARNYLALEEAVLVGVADIDEANRRRVVDDFEVPAVSSVADLLALGVDAVSVATPTTSHADVVLELLEAGVHVLVEKPIATSLEEAQCMVDKARERGVLH